MQTYNYVTNVINTAFQGKEHFQNITNEVSNYVKKLSNAIQGKESFADDSSVPVPNISVGTTPNLSVAPSVGIAGVLFYVLLLVIFFCLYAYGAARLSYCYNIYNGSDSMTATLWSILSFFFAGWYYPIYGVFLNPVCRIGPKQFGGRRR